ncbi:hypothetical protein EK21DRAFT_87029 [Setomelanomma holmii]|uniref:Uncharacterized protein n=1 Tax=Setomelanomma holmii TaxID=210430 RepID=A0A9P4HDQ6_9PLEO|nr:hypothetical protein EK21DRAFT_87029 [Setomelanomma holmii]
MSASTPHTKTSLHMPSNGEGGLNILRWDRFDAATAAKDNGGFFWVLRASDTFSKFELGKKGLTTCKTYTDIYFGRLRERAEEKDLQVWWGPLCSEDGSSEAQPLGTTSYVLGVIRDIIAARKGFDVEYSNDNAGIRQWKLGDMTTGDSADSLYSESNLWVVTMNPGGILQYTCVREVAVWCLKPGHKKWRIENYRLPDVSDGLLNIPRKDFLEKSLDHPNWFGGKSVALGNKTSQRPKDHQVRTDVLAVWDAYLKERPNDRWSVCAKDKRGRFCGQYIAKF